MRRPMREAALRDGGLLSRRPLGDAPCCIGQGRATSTSVGEDEVTNCDEVSSRCREWVHLVQGNSKSDTGDLDRPRPPSPPVRYPSQRPLPSRRVGLSEHDVIGTSLARDHGVMAGSKRAATDNGSGTELCKGWCEG